MAEFFPNVPKIEYEGPKSKNPLAFKHYNPDEVIEGQIDAGSVPVLGLLLAHVPRHRHRPVRRADAAASVG